MNYFIFYPHDQKHTNWLIHTEQGMRIGFRPKARYERFVCPKCGKFSHDEVFQEGFDDDVKFRVAGDIFARSDGFFCVNEKFVGAIQACRFPGVSLKPIGKTGWHAVNINIRIEVTPDVFQVIRAPCERCGRPREILGGVQHTGQLKSLPDRDCFFSTVQDRAATGLSDRDILVTEAIVAVLKQNHIKGGVFHLLQAPEKYAELQAVWRRGERLKPPKGSIIVL